MALFAEELKDKDTLLERQLARKTEVLTLQRAEASLAGDLGELTGRIADAKERIARAKPAHCAFALGCDPEGRAGTARDGDGARRCSRADRAAQDVVERIEVRAPVRGIVVKQNFHTAGGVAGARRRDPGAAARAR